MQARVVSVWCALSAGLVFVSLGCGGDSAPPRDAGWGLDAGVRPDAAGCRCASDLDCDDGLFCNGGERCAPSVAGADSCGCVEATTPCRADETCDEGRRTCEAGCSDADGDGRTSAACGGDDCDDDDATRYAGAAEICDDVAHDEDCDATTFGDVDTDADGYADAECCNVRHSGERACGTDCDDARADVHPGAADACNGMDDDCDGNVDEDPGITFYRDLDGDGFGLVGDVVLACSAPPGYAVSPGDCNDTQRAIHPSAPDSCNGVDDDCDGAMDPGCVCVDGVERACGPPEPVRGVCQRGMQRCVAGGWASSCPGAVLPSAERCNGLDDDCDGTIDDGVTVACYADADDDGWAPAGAPTGSFCPVAGRAAEGGCPVDWTQRNPTTGAVDCADDDASRSPGHAELCNGRDDDCDGLVDDGASAVCGAPSALTACLAGRCVVTGCASGRSDCDRSGTNGCEIDTTSSAANCGACGVRCAFGSCTAGLCSPVVITQVAAGASHTCARLASGKVGCWGRNNFGQLGDGSGLNSLSPVEVPGLTGVVQIAAGSSHSCAVVSTGDVYCWGLNTYGQLGDGSVVNRPVPTRVPGLSGVAGVAAASDHTCAQLTAGGVRCWGRNNFGQLGDGTTTDRLVPTAVPSIANAVELALGQLHSCARLATGTVSCWGDNGQGQLGIVPSVGPQLVPVDAVGITGAIGITAGARHTCAVRSTGALSCWGNNFYGQLGDGTTTTRGIPITASGSGVLGFMVAEAGATSNSTCARLMDGTVSCWGRNNAGQLGDGAFTDRSIPGSLVVGLADATSLSETGGGHVCTVRSTGGLACWGNNNQGQLGDGTTADSPTMGPVRGLADPTKVSAGGDHTCVRRATGSVECWGRNTMGQLGDGTTVTRGAPASVSALSDAVAVAAGSSHTCALRSSGRVACWGNNFAGQLGDGTLVSHSEPADVLGVMTAVEIAPGANHTCARLAGGTVACWGSNVDGVLGDGTTTNSPTPVAVVGLSDAVELVAGGNFNCARRPNGTVVCWGRNSFGSLGDGTTVPSSTPMSVLGLTDAVALAPAQGRHMCALRAGGQLVCWGYNGFGQLGDATATSKATPVQAIGTVNSTEVTAGADHTCARRSTSTVVCFGRNREGELGDGTTTDRWTSVPADTFGPVLSLAAGGLHTCVMRVDRSIACLGSNGDGQLGDGTLIDRLDAVTVLGF